MKECPQRVSERKVFREHKEGRCGWGGFFQESQERKQWEASSCEALLAIVRIRVFTLIKTGNHWRIFKQKYDMSSHIFEGLIWLLHLKQTAGGEEDKMEEATESIWVATGIIQGRDDSGFEIMRCHQILELFRR